MRRPPADETFHAKGGLREMVQFLNQNRKSLHPEVIYIETERDDIGIELAMQYNDGYNENVFSFVNNINTHEGGTHLDGLQGRADAHDQRLCGEGRVPQEGQLHPVGRRCPRGTDRGALGQGPRAAVRGADQDEARQLRSRGRGADRRQRDARRLSRRASARRQHRRSRKRCRRPGRARPRARRAISRARRTRSMSAHCPASWPIAR